MREFFLLGQLYQSYRHLNLSYSRLATAFMLMFLTAILEAIGLSILYPLVLAMGSGGRAVDTVFSYFPASLPALEGPRSQMILLLCGVAILNIAKSAGLYFSYRYNIEFAMYYYRHLIRGLYGSYVHKPVFEFRKESSGSLANIVCVQSGRLVDLVIRPLLVVITEAFLLAAISIVVFIISPGLIGVVILACGSAGTAYYALLRGKALTWGKRRMQAASVLQELVNNTAVGIREIKVFGKEEYLASKVYSAAAVETDMFRNLEMYQHGPRFLIESVFVVTFAGSFITLLLIGTDLSVLLAKFSVIAASSFRMLPCINRLIHSYSAFSFNLGPALSLLQTIADSKLLSRSRRKRGKGEERKRFRDGAIRLEHVSFEYPLGGKRVLSDINGVINPGDRIGIVGVSGSGKSTLIEVLAALYVPTRGAVLVDGQSISDEPKSWQANVGYVPQVSFIMPGTIRENIAFEAGTEGTDDEVWRALGKVGLSSFVASLPYGIYTEIGEKRLELSGGQKQLLCMARALFRDPGVLLLDEPTAALDPNNEEMVLKAIKSLPPQTTIVMVSHKRDNFRDFGWIYVCEDGRLTRQECSSTVLAAQERNSK